ncbi:MAG: hypothetical protein ACUVX8_07375 [Candidatus Zipacnadales bacterium]
MQKQLSPATAVIIILIVVIIVVAVGYFVFLKPKKSGGEPVIGPEDMQAEMQKQMQQMEEGQPAGGMAQPTPPAGETAPDAGG